MKITKEVSFFHKAQECIALDLRHNEVRIFSCPFDQLHGAVPNTTNDSADVGKSMDGFCQAHMQS